MLVRDSFESVWWAWGLFGGCNWFRYANVDDAVVPLCLVWKEIKWEKIDVWRERGFQRFPGGLLVLQNYVFVMIL